MHGIYIQHCGKAFGKLSTNPDVLKDVCRGTGHAQALESTSENTQLQRYQEIVFVLKKF